MSWELPSTVQDAAAPKGARRSLVIVGPAGVQTFWLDADGRYTLGRSPENEIVVDDPAMSRVHSAVHVGANVEVEDLGSANGTRMRGAALAAGERRTLEVGDTFELGSTIVVLQRVTKAERRRLRTHAYFEARLEEECARRGAQSKRTPFAVVRLSIAGEASAADVEAALLADLEGNDVVAAYAPDQLEILLVDRIRASAEKVTAAILKRLESAGADAKAGIALHPEHGITAEELIAAATASLAKRDKAKGGLVRADPAMRELYRVVDRVAQGTISVLLLGETGVGKEVVAEAIHKASPRNARPFVRLNCAALSESLVESELFGFEKGAFTGADRTKPGLLEAAAGGTIFLDEVGELAAATQAKLLRAIEQREVLRVGSVAPVAIDVRFVSATNRELEAEIAAGRFRSDLYYRLNGATLAIPPLRQRPTEIEPLATFFLERASTELGLKGPPALAPATLDLLRSYPWPGNIRELRNVIERAVLLCEDQLIEPFHLPSEKLSASWPDHAPKGAALSAEDQAHKARILAALEECAGNQTRAAEVLGVARQTLTKWLTRYGMPRPRKARRE